ncbi:MAG: hypothetical protein SNJ78_11740, partial [Spirochaetales bacterium]
IYYWYTDVDVQLSGSYSGDNINTTLNLSLKAGWNRVILTYNGEMNGFTRGDEPANAIWLIWVDQDDSGEQY